KEIVSIIVPVYNVRSYLADTIETVRNQTYPYWELILVDDCSTDGTKELLAGYEGEQIRVLYQDCNQGAAKARNRGIDAASGRYLAFLDADDLWAPAKLEREIAYMRDKKAAFVFCSYEFADEAGIGNGKIAHVPTRLCYKQALKNTIIFTTTVLFDMHQLTKEDIRMPAVKSEDTATWWRILRSGYTAYGLDEVLAYYRRPAQSLSSNKLEAIRRIWHLYRRVEGLPRLYSAYNFCFYAVRTVLRRL
ncbi:MAG: glycosyltransferase family 2 protein, partial [Clostridium sp.]